MLKTKNVSLVSVHDWDTLVTKVYGRPYSFQQQEGCQERGTVHLTIPSCADDYENDTVPEEINGEEMGVSFKAWLERDPNEWNGSPEDQRFIGLFWSRNFYPNLEMVANDLHAKGMLAAGAYAIEIDW